MPDRHSFLYDLQSRGLTDNWLPFDQTKFINEHLHGGIPTRSTLWEGVCSAMCFFVLKNWISGGVNGDVLSRMEQHDVAQGIADYMHDEGGESTTYFISRMRRDMYRLNGRSPHIGYKDVIEATTQYSDFCLTGWVNAVEDNGHAIICNGAPNFAIFDPNVGFIQAKNQMAYTFAFMRVMTAFYPEYCGADAGASVVRFGKVGG